MKSTLFVYSLFAVIVASSNSFAKQIPSVPAAITTAPCGGNGGLEFKAGMPESIGVRTGNVVDAIIINGKPYGGGGGEQTTQYQLQPGDYWTDFEVRGGQYVDYIYMKSKHGVEFRSKDQATGGSSCGKVTGARVLEVMGKYGQFIDSISFKYIPDYDEKKYAQTKGMWVNVCSSACNKKITDKFEQSESTKQSTSQSFTESSFKATLKVSVWDGGGNADGTSRSISSTTATALENSFTTGRTSITETTVQYTLEEMAKFGFDNVWQWKMYNPTFGVWETTYKTCTLGGEAPKWLPTDNAYGGACITPGGFKPKS